MTEEEILNKAHDYARNNIERTEEDGYDIIEEMRLVNAYLAGHEQAKKDLSCVQQRLNTLEEHNMTIDDVIACLEKHNEIHSRQEPRAYYITKALNIAIDFLKNHRWHYPSKGELPGEGREVWIYACENHYNNKGVRRAKRIKGDLWTSPYSDYLTKDIVAWRYIDLPEETKC